jgi:MFS family permease
VDRLRRRPILIAADIGRAVLLATIPLAAIKGLLRMEQVYVVTLLVSFLTVFFDVAYQSYLPTLIDRADLVEGNSKLSASASVAEVGGLALAGWLVKIFTAPITIFMDAVSFAVSAVSVWLIETPESKPASEVKAGMRSEIAEGLRTVVQHPVLRALAGCTLSKEFFGGVYGALAMLYMIRDLGFSPGVLGSIWAVGGVSSLIGAAVTGRFTQRIGIGPAMILGLAISSSALFLIPLAHGATAGAAMLLIAQQISGDGFATIYQIDNVSLRQGVTTEGLLGRVNASAEFVRLGAALAGSLVGGWSGEVIGVRQVLFYAAAGCLVSTVVLVFSPVRRLRVV